MKIRHVYQPDETGCGIAVVAMVLNTTYSQVKKWMIEDGIFKSDTDYWGTSFNDIIRVLGKRGIKTTNKRRFKQWSKIPAKIAITSTNHTKSGVWHWTVYIRDPKGFFIYDPGKRCKKIRDLRGKKSGSFIEILSGY